MDCTNMK